MTLILASILAQSALQQYLLLMILTGTQSGLQSALNIINFFGKRYRIVFNADKTKLVVTGSKIDINYYSDIKPWTLHGEKISFFEDNEHLGLVVSGLHEEEKNFDANIHECRKSLFALLGPAYAYKCLLTPTVQIHQFSALDYLPSRSVQPTWDQSTFSTIKFSEAS